MVWKRASPRGTDRQMEIEVLGQTLGCILTFFSSGFHHVQRYTLVQRNRNAHRCSHTTHRAHQRSFKCSSIFNWKCLFILAVISLWLLIPMCVCVPKYELSFLRLIWCWSWNLFVPVWECGYVFGLPSLWEQTAADAGRLPHREQLWWLSSQLILSCFHFFIWQPNTINYSTW